MTPLDYSGSKVRQRQRQRERERGGVETETEKDHGRTNESDEDYRRKNQCEMIMHLSLSLSLFSLSLLCFSFLSNVSSLWLFLLSFLYPDRLRLLHSKKINTTGRRNSIRISAAQRQGRTRN